MCTNHPKSKCIHLIEWFDFQNHICMVFELLGQSVFDFLKLNEFRPFPVHHIQQFAKQLLTSVACKSIFWYVLLLLL
jgi:dual-specificity kinase